jgi:hypothetical protein
MPPREEKSRIEELKKALYSRVGPDIRTRRKLHFNDEESDIRKSWDETEDKPINQPLNQHYENNSMSFFTKVFIFSIVFFLAAVSAGAYLFFRGGNLISTNNIDIAIDGPVSIPGGEVVSFDIKVTNNNSVDLKLADLSVDFPPGSTDPANPEKELKNFRELLGDIAPGQTVDKTVKVIVFGEENLQKSIDASVSYRINGSTASFTKNKSYDIIINSSPINVVVNSYKEVTSGQDFDMKINIKSNSNQVLKNVILKANYPFGYSYVSSNISPTSDNSIWKIGDIPPKGEKNITVKGRLNGEDNDAKVFRFSVGTASYNDPNKIGTEFTSLTQNVTIQKPFVSLSISVGGSSSSQDYIGQFNRAERVEIGWFNNLPVNVNNMVISAKLSGTAYDKSSVRPDSGYFKSETNEIIWSRQTNSEFGLVGAGDSGVVSFSVIPKDNGSIQKPISNPTITVSANVSGERNQESGVPQSVSAVATRNIKVSSSIALSGRVTRSLGAFSNTGPIPPKVEKATTYTIVWAVDNTSNSISGAQVTATLPPYVKWLSNVSPSSEQVSYDQNTGTIVWDIGNVGPYTSAASRRRELSFQVSLTPSANQAGQSLTLVNQSVLTANDDFTGANLSSSQDFLTTRFSSDPAYRDGNEIVAP